MMFAASQEAKAESAAISQPVVVNGSNQGGQNVTASPPGTLTTRNNTLTRNATVKFNNCIDPKPDGQCMVYLPPFGMILVVLGFVGKYTHHTLSMWVIE